MKEMMKEMGGGQNSAANCYDSSHGVTESSVFEIDLLADAAGPEFLTEQDVRTLLGIPRSDRWGFDSEGGF